MLQHDLDSSINISGRSCAFPKLSSRRRLLAARFPLSGNLLGPFLVSGTVRRLWLCRGSFRFASAFNQSIFLHFFSNFS